MKIAIIGTGYVGLVTGACLAEFGHHVICMDNDKNKIIKITNGDLPIYEPGLKDLFSKVVNEGRLRFTSKMSEAVPDTEAVFIAVGTPKSRRGDGHADLSYIISAAKDIAKHLQDYTVIIGKSTVPVGTAEKVERAIRGVNPNVDFDVASNPEFLREGSAIEDFRRPDRVLIGVSSERAEKILREIYKPLYINETPIVSTTVRTAELTKYAANAFLAVKITFINEISNVCEAVGANVQDLAKAIGMDGRIGSKFLKPGPGYGGSCFPKDVVALIRTTQEYGESLRVVEAANEGNEAQKLRAFKKINDAIGKGPTAIAVLGLTFKPETDDMREAPSISIIHALTGEGNLVKAFDPEGMNEAKKELPEEVYYARNAYDACEGCEIVIIMTEWNQFRALNWEEIKGLMSGVNKTIVDLRNVYLSQADELRALGFRYAGLGEKLK